MVVGFGTERSRYHPCQLTKSLLTEFFEQNPPTTLDSINTTTSLSADQLIQFARVIGLDVALASYGILEELLLKANVGQSDVPRPNLGVQPPIEVDGVPRCLELLRKN